MPCTEFVKRYGRVIAAALAAASSSSSGPASVDGKKLWQSLPIEIVQLILSYTPNVDKLAAMQACRVPNPPHPVSLLHSFLLRIVFFSRNCKSPLWIR